MRPPTNTGPSIIMSGSWTVPWSGTRGGGPQPSSTVWENSSSERESGESQGVFREGCGFRPRHGGSFYVQLSQLYLQNGRTYDCEALLTDALLLWDVRLHYGLGLTLLRLNVHARTANALREVLVRQPDHPGATNRLGQLAYESRDMDSAIAVWEQGLRATAHAFGSTSIWVPLSSSREIFRRP